MKKNMTNSSNPSEWVLINFISGGAYTFAWVQSYVESFPFLQIAGIFGILALARYNWYKGNLSRDDRKIRALHLRQAEIELQKLEKELKENATGKTKKT
jgi:hypothetical protein